MRIPSPRLAALNLWLRLAVKSRLVNARDPVRQRTLFEREARFFRAPADANFAEDRIRRPDGAPMPVLWASRGRPDRHRVILFLHGGAFFSGSPRTHRHMAAILAGHAGARALVPDYRLAPEHRFPAGLEDALAAYRSLLDGGYSPRHIVLAGDSSGGGFVFSLLLRLDEAGLPQPAAVAAFSPWVDLTARARSIRRNAFRDVMLPARRFADVVGYYLQGRPATDPLASPVLGHFALPPPALILASQDELLTDDATNMAETLRRHGGDVELELWPGLPHAWPIFAGHLPEADRALERAGRFLARHMARDGDGGV